MQKKQFSQIEIELVMIEEDDILTASSGAQDTTKAEETTKNPIDTADDLPWDTLG